MRWWSWTRSRSSRHWKKRCALLLMLGEALVSEGEGTRARLRVATEVRTLAETIGDQHSISQACWIVCRSYWGNLPAFSSAELLGWARIADENAPGETID